MSDKNISAIEIMNQHQLSIGDVLKEKDKLIESLRTRIAELTKGEPVATVIGKLPTITMSFLINMPLPVGTQLFLAPSIEG
ncbi:MAG: hypothetical protein QFB87_05040 [Patescibacteria group bacterium]|nr:hypothetical protein [Patescibacteria group bacterium]